MYIGTTSIEDAIQEGSVLGVKVCHNNIILSNIPIRILMNVA